MYFLKQKIKLIPTHFWILAGIVLVGIFLRTYKFHDWLLFEFDQARDANYIGQVVSGEKPLPLLGPTMRASGESQETLFRIGPIYYYFQIISAKIFGQNPEVLAYPDLVFSILAIPLFYYFLRKYFSVNLALLLVGLYSVAFFAVKYSRFAWNPNAVPFFILLFLVSLHEFLIKQTKTNCKWVFALGISLGIGVQLHAILLLLLPTVFFILSSYLLKKDKENLKKLIIVILLALFVNIPQIIQESQTGFANTRALLNSPVKEARSEKRAITLTLADDISCNIEANSYMLSSYGEDNCNYSYVKILQNSKAGKAFRVSMSWPNFLFVLFFSLVGYFLLAKRLILEKNQEKKYFLGLVIVFAAVFFCVMIPVVGSNFKEFRYFNAIVFLPYIMLGLILEFLVKQKIKVYFLALLFFIGGLFFLNLNSIYKMASILHNQRGNNGHSVFMGELENVVKYIKNTKKPRTKVYLISDRTYSGNIFIPGAFMANKYGYELIKAPSKDNVPLEENLFYISRKYSEKAENEIEGIKVIIHKDFGEMRVYQLR